MEFAAMFRCRTVATSATEWQGNMGFIMNLFANCGTHENDPYVYNQPRSDRRMRKVGVR